VTRSRAGAALLCATWFGAVALWLAAALDRAAPRALSRTVVACAVLSTLVWIGVWIARSVLRSRRQRSLAPLVPALLLALALAVRLVGLDHEVAEGYYLDEGTYSQHAAQINDGRLLQRDFVYPHLLYYLDAFVIWAGGLFRGPVTATLELVYGLAPGEGTRRMLMRGVVALAGAVTVLPVHALGRWLGGGGPGGETTRRAEWSGALAGLLIVFSPLYNDGSHLAICDVPSAFFAALCLAATARLTERETRRGYALAGAAAGLAAAAKYPAGLVALAPAALWLAFRLGRLRPAGEPEGGWGRGLLGLPVAAAAALATFVATNPGLLAYPTEAFTGRRSLFFGSTQYSGEGWFGSVPPSAGLWYAGQLAWSFGLPGLVAGLLGLLALVAKEPSARRRLALLLPFPVLYLALIVSLGVVVGRNLYPVLPPLAAYLGAGLAALPAAVLSWRPARSPGLSRALSFGAAAAVALLLAPPVVRTVYQEIGLSRPGTRVVAREWIRENVPRGVSILREAHTPDFDPAEYHAPLDPGRRFVAALPVEEIAPSGWDFVLLSSGAHRRFFTDQGNVTDRELALRKRYRTLFETFPRVARFPGSRTRLGPGLGLYRVPAGDVRLWRAHLFRPEELFVPDGRMRRNGAVVPFRRGHWLLVKGWFEAGGYRVRVRGEIAAMKGDGREAELVVRTRDGAEVARSGFVNRFARVRLPEPERYLFYLHLPPESRVEAVGVARAGE
jgi:hypothetical protein